MQYGESFLILNIGEESVLENEMPTRVTWPGIVYMGWGGGCPTHVYSHIRKLPRTIVIVKKHF